MELKTSRCTSLAICGNCIGICFWCNLTCPNIFPSVLSMQCNAQLNFFVLIYYRKCSPNSKKITTQVISELACVGTVPGVSPTVIRWLTTTKQNKWWGLKQNDKLLLHLLWVQNIVWQFLQLSKHIILSVQHTRLLVLATIVSLLYMVPWTWQCNNHDRYICSVTRWSGCANFSWIGWTILEGCIQQYVVECSHVERKTDRAMNLRNLYV